MGAATCLKERARAEGRLRGEERVVQGGQLVVARARAPLAVAVVVDVHSLCLRPRPARCRAKGPDGSRPLCAVRDSHVLGEDRGHHEGTVGVRADLELAAAADGPRRASAVCLGDRWAV